MSDFTATTPLDDPALPPTGLYAGVVKRGLDLVICLMLLPFVLPLIAVLALAVRQRGASSFYGHPRIGRGGRPFQCWKIRTMVPDAQQRLEVLLASNPAAAAHWALHHKLTDDPRVTSFGRFLRQTSLDELPQIWNVLKGEMSLIGPRPVTEAELVYYGARRMAYLALRPGISGLWQVSGRNQLCYAQRIEMDVLYRRDLSLGVDLRILVLTVGAVLSRTGS